MRTSISVLALLIVVTAPFTVGAQDNPFNGTWHASFKTGRGIDRDGTVVFDNNTGSWDMNTSNRNDPCVGRKFPLAVEQANAEGIDFSVNGSQVLAGCPDRKMHLKSVDAVTLEGSMNGAPLILKKK